MLDMLSIRDDVLLEIAEYLDAISLQSLLSSSKQLWKFRNDDRFRKRIFPYRDSVEYEDWNNGLVESVKNQNFPQMKYFINQGACGFDEAMKIAAKHGHKNIIDFLFDNGCDSWNGAMYGAADGNRLDLLQYFVEQGANEFDDALVIASKQNYRDIIDYILGQSECDLDKAMTAACESGNKELVEYFIEKSASDFESGLIAASEFCHIELVKLFLDKDAIDLFRDGGWYSSIDKEINLMLKAAYETSKRKWRVPGGLY